MTAFSLQSILALCEKNSPQEHHYHDLHISLLDQLGDCERAFCAGEGADPFRSDLAPSSVITHAHNALDCYNTVRVISSGHD